MSEKSDKRVILIEVRNVYGVDKYYPKNEAAQIFAAINQAKTLSRQTLSYAKVLGYEIVQVQQKEVVL